MKSSTILAAITSAAAFSRRAWILAAAAACVGVTAVAMANPSYPEKPVKVIVPYSPGGSMDSTMRIIAQQLSLQTGKQFLVENRTGANGNIGVAYVLDAPADGYTLFASGPNLTTVPWLTSTARFKPLESFAHVARVVIDPSVISVPASSPFKTLADLVAYAKANPGKLSYGSSGNGSPGMLSMELLKSRAGVDIRHIPYRGGGVVITDAIGAQIDVLAIGSATQLPHIKSGRLRGLGITSPQRYVTLPDVPPIADSFPGYETVTWIGISAKAGTPTPIIKFLEDQIRVALARQDVQSKFRDAGLSPSFLGHDEITQSIAAESELFRKVITEAGIKLD